MDLKQSFKGPFTFYGVEGRGKGLVGFDGVSFANCMTPQLTSISHMTPFKKNFFEARHPSSLSPKKLNRLFFTSEFHSTVLFHCHFFRADPSLPGVALQIIGSSAPPMNVSHEKAVVEIKPYTAQLKHAMSYCRVEVTINPPRCFHQQFSRLVLAITPC